MRGDETYIYSQGKVVKDKNQSRPSKKSIYSLGNILIVRPVTLSLKHNEQKRWNELSYTVGCARFFLGLPGFAYRLLIWAAVLCSNRFPSCSFGLHTWQIHIPGGGPGKKREREKEWERQKERSISRMVHHVCSCDTFQICLCSAEQSWPAVPFPSFPLSLEEKKQSREKQAFYR